MCCPKTVSVFSNISAAFREYSSPVELNPLGARKNVNVPHGVMKVGNACVYLCEVN